MLAHVCVLRNIQVDSVERRFLVIHNLILWSRRQLGIAMIEFTY